MNTVKFYIRINPCNICKRYTELPLGISVSGWRFLFYVNTTYQDAAAYLIEIMKDAEVYDEYGNYVTIADFASILLSKTDKKTLTEASIGSHKDKYWTDGKFDYRKDEEYDYRKINKRKIQAGYLSKTTEKKDKEAREKWVRLAVHSDERLQCDNCWDMMDQ